MKPLKIRTVVFGEGIPKICVPIVGRTQEEIFSAAAALKETPAHVAEWRADWFSDILNENGKPNLAAAIDTLKQLRIILGDMPLLFTFRTAAEGGEKSIDFQNYRALNLAAVENGLADLADVEFFTAGDDAEALVEELHKLGGKVIVSSHDFYKTPETEVLTARLCSMRNIGADLPKIAVMPKSRKDVLTLLEATENASSLLDCPIITMSMSGSGTVSRLCGEVFGSAMTFGSAGKASAPGQIDVQELSVMLELLHKSLQPPYAK
ncbi:MAG: type I 3-dehydroquinate dehydratase [Clostridium sp.]|nr:type I 3-dehydroquinate dehydratase [Clostridium sp.]